MRKQVCLPNKGYISGHSYEKINMVALHKIYMTVTGHSIGICQTQSDCQRWNTKYISGHRCERTMWLPGNLFWNFITVPYFYCIPAVAILHLQNSITLLEFHYVKLQQLSYVSRFCYIMVMELIPLCGDNRILFMLYAIILYYWNSFVAS